MRLISLLLVALAVVAPIAPAAEAPPARPPEWAVPMTEPGLPNLHRVAPNLYRGAQPSAEGMRRLAALGIRTVISLRAFHDDVDEAAGTALALERISFKTWHPEDEDVLRFLTIVLDPARQPVFVHCQHGADRTGMMCAVYRIAVDGWNTDQALREMTQGGFNFHSIWRNVIAWVKKADIPRLKQQAAAALKPTVPAPVPAPAPLPTEPAASTELPAPAPEPEPAGAAK